MTNEYVSEMNVNEDISQKFILTFSFGTNLITVTAVIVFCTHFLPYLSLTAFFW